MERDETFETADMALAAYLLTRGYELGNVQDDNPMRVRFRFVKQGQLDGAVGEFYTGQATVSALRYWEQLERVRDIVWDARRKGKGGRSGRQNNFGR